MGETVAIISAVVSAATSIAGGIAANAAAQDEKRQLEEESENARVAGLQEETERKRELMRALATNDTIRGARGVELYSPTAENIRDEAERAADEDVNTIRLNALNRQRRYDFAASQAGSRGTGQLLAGVGQGLASAGRAAGRISDISNRPGS